MVFVYHYKCVCGYFAGCHGSVVAPLQVRQRCSRHSPTKNQTQRLIKPQQVGRAEKEQAKRRQKLEALAPEKIKEEQAIKVGGCLAYFIVAVM